ncbi:aromatic acid exporter family protein [Micromonospora sp. PPF5-17]|uniref:FUSC family protein n=1 Tax=Micromonospora TaxID=1873 RepID=UPI001319F855|nr:MULTISPECIES: FUSC family protein [Micromonospora]NES39492.1 aromatic acid exporter family protein [Micromonospora solifontis]NES59037.1 aromatic acid exporter family protein [Micromonospora sp. PPF5-6]
MSGDVAHLPQRARHAVRERWQRLRALSIVVLQTSLAAAASWAVATRVVGNPEPVFALISAVITLGVSTGQRFRRAVELVLGVSLGIAVGDALIYFIGTGGWQIAVAVALAMGAAIVAGGSGAVVGQAAASAVLISTLTPPTEGIYFSRVIDALVGGGIALVVMAVLLPVNPLTVVSRVAKPALGVLIDGLAGAAHGLRAHDAGPAHDALVLLSEGEEKLDEFHEILPEGQEVATVAPLRWRARNALRQYLESAEYIDRSIRNARVLARRTVTLLRDGEPAPAELGESVGALAEATRVILRDLGRGVAPEEAAGLLRRAARDATTAYRQGLGFSGNVVVAQIRAIATDLLGTTGLTHEEADREVRRAGGVLFER